MNEQTPEFFKLDDIDRKVLAWLTKHVKPNSVKSWIEFITQDYKRRGILIDSERLFNETQESM